MIGLLAEYSVLSDLYEKNIITKSK